MSRRTGLQPHFHNHGAEPLGAPAVCCPFVSGRPGFSENSESASSQLDSEVGSEVLKGREMSPTLTKTETAMCPPEPVGLRTASKVLLPAGALRTSILGSPCHEVCPGGTGMLLPHSSMHTEARNWLEVRRTDREQRGDGEDPDEWAPCRAGSAIPSLLREMGRRGLTPNHRAPGKGPFFCSCPRHLPGKPGEGGQRGSRRC